MIIGVSIFTFAIGIIVGAIIMDKVNNKKCKHKYEFITDVEVYDYECPKNIPYARHRVYQCTICLESKKVSI